MLVGPSQMWDGGSTPGQAGGPAGGSSTCGNEEGGEGEERGQRGENGGAVVKQLCGGRDGKAGENTKSGPPSMSTGTKLRSEGLVEGNPVMYGGLPSVAEAPMRGREGSGVNDLRPPSWTVRKEV